MDLLERIRSIDLRARLGDQHGLALVATILVLALVAAMAVTAINGAMTSLRTTGHAHRDARAFYAAEAGGEYALAQIRIALRDGFLSDEELASLHPPEIQGFDFDSFTVWKQGEPTVETITDGPYAGLYSLTQNVEVYARVEDPDGNVSAVRLHAKAQAIPIFQFGVFFENDLEGTNGPPLEFEGRVHSNGNLYLSSRNAWYREMVTTPNKVVHDRKDHHRVYDGVYINDAEGNEARLDFDSRTVPGAEAFKAESCRKFDCRLQTDAFGVDSLNLPLPPGIAPYELVRPRDEGDSESERQVKYAWAADTYVAVDLADIRTRGAVCAGGGTPPDDISGEITITALDEVYPGAGWVKFTASHPDLECHEFDWRAQLEVDADEWEYDGTMDGCTFDVFIPGDAEEVEIEIQLDEDDYSQLEDEIKGTAWWDIEDKSPSSEDTTPWPNITIQRPGGRSLPTDADKCNIFNWTWEAFHDDRELNYRDVLQLDIRQLTLWGSSQTDPENAVQVIYVEITGTPPSPEPADVDEHGDSVHPSLRIANGEELPNPLTVVTEWPIYVWGDYNRKRKQPASLVGDAITILSNDWRDSEHQADRSYNETRARKTEVNAAILAGHSPTVCDHEEPGCSGEYEGNYGGGFHNFPRFLESWYNVKFEYTGSLTSLWASQKSGGPGTWSLRYYDPPDRVWGFDFDFLDPELLPPATPNVGNILRTGMREAL